VDVKLPKVALRQPEICHSSRNARFGPVDVEAVVCAHARLPNVEELGLDHAGVRLGDDGRVTVDQQQRTSAAGIYAAGDVTGPPWLTNRAVAAAARRRGPDRRAGPRPPAGAWRHPRPILR
jgi:pyruvate/2-oxoglutarate dehydrogenase complex dihydrolipoamide dehydrogenase (E3) component